MKRRWKILIAVGVVLAVGVLAAVVRHYQLRSATEAYIAKLKAEGEPMDLAQVLPPTLPPEQNSADIFRQAISLQKTDQEWWGSNVISGMRMVAPGKAMICSQQPVASDVLVTNSWQTIASALARDKPSFDLLHQIIDKPDFDFHIQYETGMGGFNFTNLYLPESKRAVQRLLMAALDDLHNGDTASAVEDLRTMLGVTRALRNERYLISELVRIAMAQTAMPANWELLQSTNLTDGQLAELQQDWSSLDFVQNAEAALEMEREIGEISVTEWRNSDGAMLRFIYRWKNAGSGLDDDEGSPDIKTRAEVFMWRHWWSYPDELRALKEYQIAIDTMRSACTNAPFQSAMDSQNAKLGKLGAANPTNDFVEPDIHWIASEDYGYLSGLLRRVMTVQAAKQMTITAIALKRYELKYGSYPSKLEALVPEFLPAVPLDPVDGNPLRYRLKTNGTFLLYSIGPNGKDDGGDPSLEPGVEGSNNYWLNQHALDWVWPQPATAAEIQDFYAHQQK